MSDWDFAVETDDFPSVARDLPRLVDAFQPIARQWDPLSDRYAYMLMLHGPIKVDLNFREPHAPAGPWAVTAGTLPDLDAHFWDWTLWLTSKQASGQVDLIARELVKMWEYLLRPLGVGRVPQTIKEATVEYRAAREVWEGRLGVAAPRDLEREVLPLVR